MGVGGESVPARVQPKRGSAWHREIKSHIGGLLRKVHYYKIQDSKLELFTVSVESTYFVEELDVEISKWRDSHCKLFSQSNL